MRGFVWSPKKLPKDVFQAELVDGTPARYTFEPNAVTCEACWALESLVEYRAQREEFDRKVAESGLTETEYIEKIRKKTLAKLRAR